MLCGRHDPHSLFEGDTHFRADRSSHAVASRSRITTRPAPRPRPVRKQPRPLPVPRGWLSPADRRVGECRRTRPCRRASRSGVRFRLRLEIELLLKVPDVVRRFKAHRQSPSALLAFLRSAPEVRPLSSTGITRLHRSYEPVQLPIAPPPKWWRLRWQPPRARVSPDESHCLINVPCPLPRPIGTGAYVRFPSPFRAAFPVTQAGRHPHRYFRGLLGLHSRYGPLTRSAAQGDLCHKASTRQLLGQAACQLLDQTGYYRGGAFLHQQHAPSGHTVQNRPARRRNLTWCDRDFAHAVGRFFIAPTAWATRLFVCTTAWWCQRVAHPTIDLIPSDRIMRQLTRIPAVSKRSAVGCGVGHAVGAVKLADSVSDIRRWDTDPVWQHLVEWPRAGANPPSMCRYEKPIYGVSGSMWTILPFCWPSVHMLERTPGFELFCTSICRVFMESGSRYELHSPVSTLSR